MQMLLRGPRSCLPCGSFEFFLSSPALLHAQVPRQKSGSRGRSAPTCCAVQSVQSSCLPHAEVALALWSVWRSRSKDKRKTPSFTLRPLRSAKPRVSRPVQKSQLEHTQRERPNSAPVLRSWRALPVQQPALRGRSPTAQVHRQARSIPTEVARGPCASQLAFPPSSRQECALTLRSNGPTPA